MWIRGVQMCKSSSAVNEIGGIGIKCSWLGGHGFMVYDDVSLGMGM